MDQNGQIALVIFLLLFVLGALGVVAYRSVQGIARSMYAARQSQQPAESTEITENV